MNKYITKNITVTAHQIQESDFAGIQPHHTGLTYDPLEKTVTLELEDESEVTVGVGDYIVLDGFGGVSLKTQPEFESLFKEMPMPAASEPVDEIDEQVDGVFWQPGTSPAGNHVADSGTPGCASLSANK